MSRTLSVRMADAWPGSVADQVLRFIEATGTKALALRSDVYYRLCDQLLRKDEWIGELNGCLIFLGTRSEGRTTPLPVQRCRRFRG